MHLCSIQSSFTFSSYLFNRSLPSLVNSSNQQLIPLIWRFREFKQHEIPSFFYLSLFSFTVTLLSCCYRCCQFFLRQKIKMTNNKNPLFSFTVSTGSINHWFLDKPTRNSNNLKTKNNHPNKQIDSVLLTDVFRSINQLIAAQSISQGSGHIEIQHIWLVSWLDLNPIVNYTEKWRTRESSVYDVKKSEINSVYLRSQKGGRPQRLLIELAHVRVWGSCWGICIS